RDALPLPLPPLPTRRSSDLYTVANGGANETANITVNVAAVADIVADVVNTNEDTAVTFNPVSGLNEVSGADNFEGTATIIQINGTAITAGGPGVTVDHGTVTLGANNALTFTLNTDHNCTSVIHQTAAPGAAQQ